jgi:hypothetical protein
MSFFRKLFGGGESAPAGPAGPDGEEEYKGHTIRAQLMKHGSEYGLAGEVEKTIDGEARTHRFIRADRFAVKDEAIAATLRKGRQLVDEQGDGLYK